MENKIKEAFSEIEAEEALIHNTKQFLKENSNVRKKSGRNSKALFRYAISFCAVALLAVSIVGVRSVKVEAAYIQIDSSSSIGLSLNHWKRVIRVVGLNNEGEKVIEKLSLEGMDYDEAVNTILASNEYVKYAETEESCQVTVKCHNPDLEESMQQELTSICNEHENHNKKALEENQEQDEKQNGDQHQKRTWEHSESEKNHGGHESGHNKDSR